MWTIELCGIFQLHIFRLYIQTRNLKHTDNIQFDLGFTIWLSHDIEKELISIRTTHAMWGNKNDSQQHTDIAWILSTKRPSHVIYSRAASNASTYANRPCSKPTSCKFVRFYYYLAGTRLALPKYDLWQTYGTKMNMNSQLGPNTRQFYLCQYPWIHLFHVRIIVMIFSAL